MLAKKLAFITAIVITGFFLLSYLIPDQHTITVGTFDIEYGWVNEPVIAGQPNAIAFNITNISASTANSAKDNNFDISNFVVQIKDGNQSRVLELQPLGDNTSGHYIAPMTPAQPGAYILHLSGTIGSTTFNYDVTPGEVSASDPARFPSILPITVTSSIANLAFWFGMAGLVLGASGIVIGIFSVNHKQGII